MIQNFKIDQAATFASVRLLSVEAKAVFGDNDRQETTKDGVPKWEAQLVAGFRQFGKTQNEIIKASMAAEHDPGEGIAPATPVELIDFEIGVMEKQRDGQVVGVQVWYRCQGIRPIAATGSSNGTDRKTRNGSTSATSSEAAEAVG
ncbi:MAG: hypothetical protein GEV09_11215 [Pseudonocardiaceae bacterium]|nr:hypothetical protein [Pseudonocardiaceae bacterium]